MNITAAAIENNRVTIFVVIALLFGGVSSYIALPKAQDPGFTIRTATVTTAFPGASAERVELLVTDALEDKISEMPELDELTSESRTGISILTVTFDQSHFDMQPIFDDLRRKVESMASELPDGAYTSVVNDEYGDTYGHLYTLLGDGFSAKELSDYATDIRDALLLDPDVAKVDVYGDQQESIYIEYDNARLTELGLSPQELQGVLQSLNILSSGGDIVIGTERIDLEPSGNFERLSDIENSIVEIPGSGTLIRLRDIAEIKREYIDPPEVIVRADGQRAISLAISMVEGGNILELGERLRTTVPNIEATLPLGIRIEPMFMQSILTGKSVDAFVENLVQAVLIVIVVMVLSLGFRSGLVVGSLIPVVMVSTFFVMAQFDIGIDQISLAALIIALGLLVDNGIVVVEATIVQRQQGVPPVQASIQAAKEMMVPLLISSLTTAAAFTPIALAEAEVSEFTSPIFYVVTIALLLSWLIAMTFLPMATRFINVDVNPNSDVNKQFDTKAYSTYRNYLRGCLDHPIYFSVVVIGLFALAMYGFAYIPKVFIPPSEDPVLSASLDLPTGTDILAAEGVISDIEAYLQSQAAKAEDPESKGVTGWTTYIGSGGPRFVLGFNPPNPNAANTSMILSVASSESIEPVKAHFEHFLAESYPDMKYQIKRLANGPPVDYPIEVKISGPDYNRLFKIMKDIKAQLWTYPEVTAVSDNWGPQGKKLTINIDQARALRAGVSSEDIALSLQTNLSGLELTEFREGDDVIPVVMRTRSDDNSDLARLENITVFSSTSGTSVPLSQVADINVVWEPTLIKRLDRMRNITIQAQLRSGATANEIATRYRPWLDEFASTWGSSYSYTEGGESEESDASNAAIGAALPFALIMIVLLLVLQFNSARRTAIVLLTIPLGLVGVVVGLLVLGSTFGFFTFLGIVSLAGIVINNAIVLLDRIKLEMEDNGLPESEAILQAAQQRARPILLTTATTVGGMLPLWLGGGPMFESMAIAILFGLLFATLITLFMVPVLYSTLFRVQYDGG